MANKPRIRFRGFTEDWEQRNLGNLAEIVRGASPRPISDSKWFDNNSDVGWLRISDVTAQDGRIQYLEQKISKLGQDKTRVVKTPHLLLSIAATVGKPVINYVPTGVHDGFLIFLNPKFNILYAFWWLEMFREEWNKYGQPGSQVNLNSDLVKNQVINIPNEKEQEKISSFLEALDRIITLHQCKLKKLNLAKKSLLQKLFPRNGSQIPGVRFKGFTDAWEQRKLGDVADVRDGTHDSPKFYNDGFPLVTSKNLKDGSIDFLDCSFISKQDFDEINKRSKVDSGDILFGMIGTIGNPAIVEHTGFAIKNVALIKEGIIVNNRFIYHLLSSKVFDNYIARENAGGTQKFIALNQIRNFIFLAPTLEEQNKIIELLDYISQTITLHQRKLDCLISIKKGLLQQLFV